MRQVYITNNRIWIGLKLFERNLTLNNVFIFYGEFFTIFFDNLFLVITFKKESLHLVFESFECF
jgi:hypothetical protein